VWSLEKLAILHLYLPGFTHACGDVPAYYVDGFAGPGVCTIKDSVAPPHAVWGSPIVALRTEPPFAQCLFMDLNQENVSVLEQRARRYGDRWLARRGDANVDLSRFVAEKVPPWAPCFCLLDPEGLELHWESVHSLSRTQGHRRKPELLVLFPSEWLTRLLPTEKQIDPTNETTLDRVLPSKKWRDIYRKRVVGAITPAQAKNEYLELYRSGLESLGYNAFAHSVKAPRTPGGRRRTQYHLIFATEREAGVNIMRDVFRRPYLLDFPVSRQPPLPSFD